ncbi:hypothetical protein [Gloeobacter kilaueensis]|uniref:Uncharacterized protein n=1 Tax=Gloeobacter kilaueensis (strain ATCC BAA-2537 / CCAP 1431/1 / ULC 316 / JS1) TaxID=1183438 RepID=U5QQN4_GLOK1|nr:hypothetical protein [Gloeobacter kilaueensis]AGY59929.1 hypothetical protein GKIL_3683 [Gloeobacter kilaueensis JS1]
MTSTLEQYRKQLIELQLDIEKVQAYVLKCTAHPIQAESSTVPAIPLAENETKTT